MAKRNTYFYNSRKGDRKYNADSMGDWLMPFFTTGVFNNCFAVKANNDMTVSIVGGPIDGNTSFVNIKGKVMKQVGTEVMDVAVASGTLPRIDSAILRRDDIKREIYPLILFGSFSNNPQLPPLIRENGIHDLQLAWWRTDPGTGMITQDMINDTRMKADLCGWVMSTVKEIDFNQITAQFNAFFTRYEALVAARFTLFDETMQGHEAAAQAAYDEFTARMIDLKAWALREYTEWSSDFKIRIDGKVQSWFEDFRNNLSDDQAVKLFNKIYNHEQATVFNKAVHGIRLQANGQVQFHHTGTTGAGWAKLGADGKLQQGITLDYAKGLGWTLDDWNNKNITLDEMNHLIEVEA